MLSESLQKNAEARRAEAMEEYRTIVLAGTDPQGKLPGLLVELKLSHADVVKDERAVADERKAVSRQPSAQELRDAEREMEEANATYSEQLNENEKVTAPKRQAMEQARSRYLGLQTRASSVAAVSARQRAPRIFPTTLSPTWEGRVARGQAEGFAYKPPAFPGGLPAGS